MKSISLIVGDITRFGGTERAVTNLANLLMKSYKVSIISLYHPVASKPQFRLMDGVSVDYLKFEVPDNFIQRNYQYLKFIYALRHHISRAKTDFLISTAHAVSFILPLVVLCSKTKSIAAEHITRSSLPLFSRLLQRLSYPFLHAIVLLSESAEKKYSFLKNTHVIPNSLSFFPSEISCQNNKTILSVGRISYEKGFDRLVDMAKLMKNSTSEWRIKIFGNGNCEEDIRKAIKEHELTDFIVMSGAVKDIEKEYLKADIYLMTSRFEAFPMVLLEAKACGLPVVTYDCPEGPGQIVKDGYDGYLIEDGNAASMVEKLRLLMLDNELRRKMSTNARESVVKYKDELVVEKWNSLFDNLLL